MQSHGLMQPPDAPTGLAEAKAHFRLLAADHVGAVTLHLLKRADPYERIAAADFHIPERILPPLDIYQQIIDRFLGKALAAQARNHRHILMLIQKPLAFSNQPATTSQSPSTKNT